MVVPTGGDGSGKKAVTQDASLPFCNEKLETQNSHALRGGDGQKGQGVFQGDTGGLDEAQTVVGELRILGVVDLGAVIVAVSCIILPD